MLAPHVNVACGAIQGRLDDLLGIGFSLISAVPQSLGELSTEARAILAEFGVRCTALAADTSNGSLVDLDGRLTAFLSAHEWNVMIVRPDFYVYGGARGPESLEALVRDLGADLQAAGVHRLNGRS